MTTKYLLTLVVPCILFILLPHVVFSQLSVITDRPTGRYNVGDTIFFIAQSNADTSATFSIKSAINADLPPLSTGTCEVRNGFAFIAYVAKSVGFVHCAVTQMGQTNYGGAAIEPFSIHPDEPEAADFDAFWSGQKALLAAVPFDANVRVKDSTAYAISFTFDIALPDGKRAYGYLSVPRGNGLYPAIIQLPAFGNTENVVGSDTQLSERAGVISVYLNIHNNLPTQAAPVNYVGIGIENPATYYYKHIILSVVRTVDYLQTRADFNGQVGIVGVSQGAGLAILAAGIEQRISLLVNAFPALCGHPNLKYNKPSGFPNYWHLARSIGLDQNMVMNTVKYYDAVTSAKRFKGVSWTMVGYRDEVCNPATVIEAFNQIKGQKILSHYIQRSHIQTPDAFAKPETPIGMYAFFRQHFPATNDAPWTWTNKTVGYKIDVGKDIELTNTASTLLRGTIELEMTNRNLPMRWEKIEGAGSVVFSNPTALTTTATFSQAGTYRVRLMAEDVSALANEDHFVTLSDDLIIKVSGTVPVELVSFTGKEAEKSNQLAWTTAYERDNKSFDIQRSADAKNWQILGTIAGKGNTNAKNNYEFEDTAPLSKTYYRLQQTDFSGLNQYSKTIVIERVPKIDFVVYPNPVSGILFADLKGVKPPFDFTLRDDLGRVLLTQFSNNPITPIHLSHLGGGQYFLEIKTSEGKFVRKIIKKE